MSHHHRGRLGQPDPAYSDDHGEADPALRAALAAVGESREAYLDAVVALGASRLLLPIVTQDGDGAAVLIENQAGERALVAFSGLDSLRTWNADARPVPCTIDELAGTVAEASAVALIIDPSGPAPFALDGDLLGELAAGRRLIALDDGGYAWMMRAD